VYLTYRRCDIPRNYISPAAHNLRSNLCNYTEAVWSKLLSLMIQMGDNFHAGPGRNRRRLKKRNLAGWKKLLWHARTSLVRVCENAGGLFQYPASRGGQY